MNHPLRLKDWPVTRIDANCADAHGAYDRQLSRHYADYFTHHPDEAGSQRFSARDMEQALPDGWGHLAAWIPAERLHRHALSGKSSQTLALGMLGVSIMQAPDLAWFWRLLGLEGLAHANANVRFEVTLDAEILNEHPRQTSIDVVVESDDAVGCIEAKLREDGLGTCRCPASGAQCSTVISKDRAHTYGRCAVEEFGFEMSRRSENCPLGTAYQGVRNVAAARAIAGDRRAVFCLVYDERNPYFCATGSWPGWPSVLRTSLSRSPNVAFTAASWQTLARTLPLDDATLRWSGCKHDL
jgi:hypothetical protein